MRVHFLTTELFFDRGNHYEFLSLVQELAAPGEIRNSETIPFEFKNVEKIHESYNGINVKLRYFLRVTIGRRMSDVVKEREICPPGEQSWWIGDNGVLKLRLNDTNPSNLLLVWVLKHWARI